MPSINMIAARRADKRRLESNRQKLFYVILGELGLVMVVVSWMLVRLVGTQIQSAELSDKLNRLKDRVAEIQSLQDAITALQPKVSALNESSSDTMFWYGALQNVTASLPTTAWLTSVSSAGDPGVRAPAGAPGAAPTASAAKLNIQGQAASQFDVGSAMLRLNCYPNIDQVKLHQVTQSAAGPSGVNFDMEVQIKPQAPLPSAQGGGNVQKS